MYPDGKKHAMLCSLRPHEQGIEEEVCCMPAFLPAGRQAIAKQRFLNFIAGPLAISGSSTRIDYQKNSIFGS
jgi:hypothetical protein